jgi:DNA-binding beta-propeller fold protein YncE
MVKLGLGVPRALRALSLLAMAAAVLAGCGTTAEFRKLAWPPPPDAPRIQFVRTISSEESVGRDPTFSESVLEVLTGKKPPANHIADPMGIAVSDDGNRVYVSDFSQFAVFVFDFQAKTMTKIGKDEPLGRPFGIALDGEENLYVVEQVKKGVSVFDRSGKRIRFFTDESLDRPAGLAIDRERGKLYLVDGSHSKTGQHDVKVFDLQGRLLGTLGKGKGNPEGYFLFPTYISVGQAGHVFVSDTLNSRVQEFDAEGKFVRHFGERGNSWGMFDKPKGVATDSFGNLYVVDSGWSNVQIFNGKGQVLLFFGGRGTYPGLLQNPSALSIDRQNRIYVGDYMNHRVEVYQLANTSEKDSMENAGPIQGAGPAPKYEAGKGDSGPAAGGAPAAGAPAPGGEPSVEGERKDSK